MQNKTRNNKGFTIIEVMIVLAIAGLIMLIVFLAVPALQRSQRNSARRSEIGRIGAAASEFVANNNGTLPTTAAHYTAILNATGTLQHTTAMAAPATLAQTANVALDTPQLVTSAVCSGTDTVAGTSRQMAIRYSLEPQPGSGASACTNI